MTSWLVFRLLGFSSIAKFAANFTTYTAVKNVVRVKDNNKVCCVCILGD
jgi:hypothetical protein